MEFFGRYSDSADDEFPIDMSKVVDFENSFNTDLKIIGVTGKTLMNTESDPKTGWSSDFTFRKDTRYSSFVVQNIVNHLQAEHLPIGLISSDNAFMSLYPYIFSKRTLFARFQVNSTDNEWMYTEFIAKPVATVFGMLAKLKDRNEKEELRSFGDEHVQKLWNEVGSELIVFDTNVGESSIQIRFSLVHLMNKKFGNPAQYYNPKTNFTKQLQKWHQASEPMTLKFLTSKKITVEHELNSPSIIFIEKCFPKKISKNRLRRRNRGHLAFYEITLNSQNLYKNRHVLFWKSKIPCVVRFWILVNGKRLKNKQKFLFVKQFYDVFEKNDEVRIQAVDFRGRKYRSNIILIK